MVRHRLADRRGSLLIVAMLFAAAIALVLVSYLNLGRTSLKVAHRSFFASDATNLAEAGLEEAIGCFNLMGSGTDPATAWAGWTISGTDAMRTLPPFNRDQNAIGIVKVFVRGYDGSNVTPYAISQATITPFDGSAPIVKVIQSGLKIDLSGFSMNGVVALNGMTIKGQSIADSFNSNPTNSPTGPWVPYSSSIARANTRVIVPAGAISMGNGTIYGNLLLGAGVAPPPASQVTGTIQANFGGTLKMPVPPTAASVSQSYNLGATIPAVLPVAGHLPAADGCYYYFCSGATIGNLTIPSGRNVVLVGSNNTNMGSGITVQGTATCAIYIDGIVTCTGTINNGSWAGALQIFTTTSQPCTIGNNGQIVACLYAPNSALTASGGGKTGMLVGYYVAKTITTTGHMDFHYDEALQPLSGNPWAQTLWFEMQSAADRATVAGLTNNFLP
ncbi:MAG: hypothetical protein PHQ04_12035 [Opitutaceae bacterium]|nr:hypothetical protein [Opitutaceae bacterium]